MKISDNGLNLIAHFEGKRLVAYSDAVGVLTIGYGHTSMAGLPIVKAGMTITDAQALDILRTDATKFEDAVNRVLKQPANQNQFDAMVSLCYNIGPGNFGASTVLADFNANDLTGAGLAFLRWCKAGGQTLQGLVDRRKTEMALFEKPVDPIKQPLPVAPPVVVAAPTMPAAAKPAVMAQQPYSMGPIAALARLLLPLFSKLLTGKA